MRPDADLICLQVEVSGWDTKGRFFVEHSVLDCFESGEKALSLRHKVGIRSVVFVRSLYSAGFAKSYPEAHHVEKVEPQGEAGYRKLHLADFPPRHKNDPEPKGSSEHPIGEWEEVRS